MPNPTTVEPDAAGAAGRDGFAITLGIEEEFFLVDPESRDLLADPDPAIFRMCEENRGPHKIVRELMRAQIETNTKVCRTIAELREALRETRRTVVAAAERHGAAAMAASTHPFAAWRAQAPTPQDRYERFTVSFQDIVRRYLPFLHALSGSSPFNAGRETGFKSWRLIVVGSLPRSGLPAAMASRAEYDGLVAEYRRMKFIENGSELWWDIRPSHAYPTVELRVCDVCTRLEDAVTVAALYACLIRRLMRLDREGALPPEPLTEIVTENCWVAQRYGVLAFLGDPAGEGGRIDIDDYAAGLVETLAPDARALGCEAEAGRAVRIIREGAGADRQIDLYRLRRLEGDSEAEALRRVVDLLLAETREGVGGAPG